MDNICDVWRSDRAKSSLIIERCGCGCGCEFCVMKRMKWKLLKYFGHVERIGENIMVKRVFRACVEGSRERGRSQRRWIDEVKDMLIPKGLSEREEVLGAREREA